MGRVVFFRVVGVTKGTRWFGSSLESSMMRLGVRVRLSMSNPLEVHSVQAATGDPKFLTIQIQPQTAEVHLTYIGFSFVPPKIEKTTTTPIPKRSFFVNFSRHFLGQRNFFPFRRCHPYYTFTLFMASGAQLKGPSIPIWAGESCDQDDMETFLGDWYMGGGHTKLEAIYRFLLWISVQLQLIIGIPIS